LGFRVITFSYGLYIQLIDVYTYVSTKTKYFAHDNRVVVFGKLSGLNRASCMYITGV